MGKFFRMFVLWCLFMFVVELVKQFAGGFSFPRIFIVAIFLVVVHSAILAIRDSARLANTKKGALAYLGFAGLVGAIGVQLVLFVTYTPNFGWIELTIFGGVGFVIGSVGHIIIRGLGGEGWSLGIDVEDGVEVGIGLLDESTDAGFELPDIDIDL